MSDNNNICARENNICATDFNSFDLDSFDVVKIPPPSNFAIDSFKIRIPIPLSSDRIYSGGTVVNGATVTDPNINVTYLTINEATGEVISKKENNVSYHDSSDGVKTQYALEQIGTRAGSGLYLTIKVVSKHLRESYFDGINRDNAIEVYRSLMRIGMFSFSFEDFLKGELTDIDFCRNLRIENWQAVKSFLIDNTKQSSEQNKGYRVYDNAIQWGSREQANGKAPYVKIYNKLAHAKQDESMLKFIDTYLDISTFTTDLYRLEFTLKNKKHFAKYGIKSNTLKSFLDLTQDNIEAIAYDVMSKHIDSTLFKPIKYPYSVNEKYPCSNNTDFLLYLVIQSYMDQNKPLAMLTQEYANFLDYSNLRTKQTSNAKKHAGKFDKQAIEDGKDFHNAEKINNAKRMRVRRFGDLISTVFERGAKMGVFDLGGKTIAEYKQEQANIKKQIRDYEYSTACYLKQLCVIQDIQDVLVNDPTDKYADIPLISRFETFPINFTT